MSPQKKKNSMDCESEGTGLKFSCKKCGKSLTTEYRRKIHFQFHCPYGPAKTGEHRNPDDPLICFNCKNFFRTVKILRRHLIRDCKTVRRFRCQLCDYTASWACRYQRHMFTAHPELMEVLHDVTMGARNQENQPETGNEEYEPETGDEDQLETGNVEEQLEAENEDDQLVTGNMEDQLETGDEEDQPIPENTLHIITQNDKDLKGIECSETQLVSENIKNLLNSDKVKDQEKTRPEAEDIENLLEVDNCIDLTENEDSETLLQTEYTGSLLEGENIEDQIESEHTVTQLGTENNENRLKRVNSENQLITKPKKVKQRTNLLNKSNTIPKFDFIRSIKQYKKLNKSKNNKSGNETTKGVKSGKENKGKKRTREEKENDHRKKIKTENEKKVENEQSYQKNDLGIKEGEENEEAEAMVPVIDLGLDQWLEGLPNLSEEDFERLKATDHIQF